MFATEPEEILKIVGGFGRTILPRLFAGGMLAFALRGFKCPRHATPARLAFLLVGRNAKVKIKWIFVGHGPVLLDSERAV